MKGSCGIGLTVALIIFALWWLSRGATFRDGFDPFDHIPPRGQYATYQRNTLCRDHESALPVFDEHACEEAAGQLDLPYFASAPTPARPGGCSVSFDERGSLVTSFNAIRPAPGVPNPWTSPVCFPSTGHVPTPPPTRPPPTPPPTVSTFEVFPQDSLCSDYAGTAGVASAAECRAASAKLGIPYTIMKRNTAFPSGCFATHVTQTGIASFNSLPTGDRGTSEATASPICRVSKTSTQS